MVYEDKLRLEEARELYKDEKYSEALIIFMDLMLASPTNGFLFFDIAKTYLKMGQPAVAMANFEKSLKFLDKVHHYDLQKEFAGMLHGMNRHQEAVNVYLPVTANAVNEEDFVTGIKYLVQVEEIDQAELLLVKNIAHYPNSFDTVCETAEVEPYVIERLRNRKRSIIQALKDNFQQTIDDTSKELDYIVAESEENTYQHLLTDWDSGLGDFDDAKTIDKVIVAKERLNAVRTIIFSESEKIKKLKATTAISELRQDNRDKIRELNNLETDLIALLPQLPATSLKTEIPSYLNVVKSFKKQIRKDDFLEVSRAFKNLDNLISEGKGYKQDGKAAIEKIAAMQAPTEKAVAKRNVAVSKKTKTHHKKDDDTVIVLDSQLNERKKGNRKVLLFFLLAIIIGGGAATYYLHFYDGNKNKRVLLTNVFLRSGPDAETDKVRDDSYKRGEKLTVLEDYGDWYFLETSDGNQGYMLAEYFGEVHEYQFIEGMFANAETAAIFESARHQMALLAFYKKNEWTSNVSSRVEKKVYGYTIEPARELRQIYGQDTEARFNGGIIEKLTYNPDAYPKKDMACIIRGEENEEIVFFAFREDNSFQVMGHETLEGRGHQLEFIDGSTDNRDWYLGRVIYGEPNYEKLYGNAILVQMTDGCARLYVYERADDKMVRYNQGSCE